MGGAVPSPGRKILATLVLFVLVFAALSVMSDVSQLGAALSGFRVGAFLSALLLVLINYGLRFWRWELYLRALAIRLPWRESLLVFLSGFVMSVTPGKMGEVFKSLLLFESREIPVERTAPVVIAERVLDLVGLLIVVAIGSSAFAHGLLLTALGSLAVAAIVAVCTIRGVADFVLDLFGRTRWLAPIVPRLREAQRSMYAIMRPRIFAQAAVLAFLGWGLEGLATYEILQGFSETKIDRLAAAFSYGAGTFAGALSMLPGGLGVAELGMKGLLQVTAEQIAPATATAATILVRLATLWFGVAVGACALACFRWVGGRGTP